MKHGYREAVVANLGDFVACKSCHFDDRVGTDKIWQLMLDDPYTWATTGDATLVSDEYGKPPGKYGYNANLMNDTHMSHAMEFPYPQSMSNCATCHAGKLDKILTDANFTAETCKSCHAVDGKGTWGTVCTDTLPDGKPNLATQCYTETKRPPALKELWAEAGVTFHEITDNCGTCHKAGGVGGQFTAYHKGYDPMIYDASGKKYNTLYKASVDSVTFNKTTNVLNIKFSATNTATIPTVTVSFYGYDSKDFYISAHTRDGSLDKCKSSATAFTGCRLEYTAGANTSTSVTDDNPLFAEVATGTAGKWEVNLDLSKYTQPTTTKTPTTSSPTIGTIPALIAAGTIKKAEVAVLPSLTISGQVAAIDAVSKTVDLATSQFVTLASNSITDVGKCNDCHDALGTTFHSPSYGGSVVVCRTCHQVTNAGSHLEMHSRSIDDYAHAIHMFQFFDTNSVDFTTLASDATKFNNPVGVARYNRHIEHTFPNFTILSCQGCHNPGKFEVPDQSKSMPSLLSGSYTETSSTPLKGWYGVNSSGVVFPVADRNIGTVPVYVAGAGGRACAGCHRAELINEDDEGDLAALNAHVAQNGFLLDNTAPNSLFYGVLDKIMGYFK
jgi:hypothetical protein